MRMFRVILLLMTVFIVCRLPNWVFLFHRLISNGNAKINWILTYTFGVVGLLNSMLNPLLYTFLGETIRITSHIGSACYKFCRRSRKSSHYANNISTNVQRKSDGGIYLGS